MIVGSVLLVVVAGVLLGLGLIYLAEPLLYSSIGVSALAALVLVLGVRRLAAIRAGQGVIAVRPGGASTPRPVGRARPRHVGRATVAPPAEEDDEVPAENLPEAELARLRDADAAVIVVDNRPRFHVAGCEHATDPDAEELGVAEALEIGFTPCGVCRPGRTLLGGAGTTAPAS